ncbi:hypothetical protein [Comamonas sp. JC664]|uniref:hypothetical protein n=1 Tax=Comamonas sp. JC664 TaxID=2801917 RepID=UPI00191F58F5|nr:hypothetical protein [Comamonas sp. JC664]MBL0698030.1 hypothetical protein [Comamonas sp. JC664]GHG70935.1 hypothetical protein GCM10012319_16320 [Comamonas sp. KCTC 72670]
MTHGLPGWPLAVVLVMTGCQDARRPDDTRAKALRTCVLAGLPPPTAPGAAWTVPGHALVEAYQRCLESPDTASAEDFHALCQDLARPSSDDPSRVHITDAPGGEP